MNDTLLRLPQLICKTGLGKSAIYARITPNPKRPNDYDPTFPKPVKLGGRAVAWLESEVNTWIAEQAASRKEAA
ncbi:helix-turn-helix transcriptional regulator [Vogesella urethralis]|uniref:helix-turn-helix transcriptional regulator n=1 Tax=Vogesella urethralis TaxID=2592656 RepID=UPI001185C480|nr:AlpA family transcriptional regulator [Vogesella urethralis]